MTEQTGEAARLAAARRLLRSAPTTPLDVLTSVTAQLLRTSAAEVSLVTDVRHTVSSAGETAREAGTSTSRPDSLCTLVVEQAAPLVVTDATQDIRVSDRPPVLDGFHGSYLGVPMLADDGHVVGSLCVHQPVPRGWTPRDEELLTELATAVTGHLEVAALTDDYRGQVRAAALEGAVRAAGIGTWEWNLSDDSLVWDDVLLELFGLSAETFGGTFASFEALVHPDDRQQVAEALDAAVTDGRLFEAEYRVLRPDGSTRWVAARGKPLPGPDGLTARIIGAVTDLTALREGEARLGEVLDSMAVGYLTLDHEWRITYLNSEAERVLGRPRAELLGHTMWERFPHVAGSEWERQYRHVAATGEPVAFDAHYPQPLNSWFEIRAVPTPDGIGVYFLDITERRAAQEVSEHSLERSTTLARTTSLFVETLDPERALVETLPLLVPRLADWAIVSVYDEGSAPWRERLRDVGSWHRAPERRALLEEYRSLRSQSFTDDSPIRRAITHGPVNLVPSTRFRPSQVLDAGRAHDLLADLSPGNTLMLPLRGRGRTRGLLTIVRDPDRELFSPEDVAALEEITGQIGLGLDNGRLYAQQRDLAEELQLSVLTDLPQPDHLRLVARYVPATDGAQIGGDWYDAFLLEGSTCLVVGDVTGHDRGAAVAMSQARNVLRGVAHALGDSPARILEALERAVRDLDVDTLGTAVLAKVEQSAADATRGRRVLRWSSAGHLPPLLLRADGTAELLDRPHDVLLGVDAGLRRHDHTVDLAPGDTVVLYTDGLVERRGEDLDVGIERLRRHALHLADRDPEQLCDDLLARLSAGSEDDVALLVVRVLDPGA